MDINNFVKKLKEKQIFWSYSKNTDIPHDIVIEHTLKYGDITDIIELFELFSKDLIVKVWLETMSTDDRFDKTNHYLKLFFFKNLEINTPLETRYEKIKRAGEEN